MAHMEKSRWEKVLGKFKKDELPVMAAEQLGLTLSPKAKTKREMVSLIVEADLTPSDLLKVELMRISRQPNSVLWSVFKLQYPDSFTLPPAALDRNHFTKRLQHYIGNVFDYTMVQLKEPTGWWLCMHISDQCRSPYTCYILLCPPSPTLFVAGVKRGHLVILLEAINLTLGGDSYVQMDLSGKHLFSLMDMVCNQYSQGSRSAYRLNQVDPNPLLVANGHTLPSLSPAHSTEEQENRQLKAATDTFGANPLPKIEKFSFKLCADLPDGSDTVRCQVTLAGSSVLEGTKAAIAADHFTLPIPEIIREMPSLASNAVTLEDS